MKTDIDFIGSQERKDLRRLKYLILSNTKLLIGDTRSGVGYQHEKSFVNDVAGKHEKTRLGELDIELISYDTLLLMVNWEAVDELRQRLM